MAKKSKRAKAGTKNRRARAAKARRRSNKTSPAEAIKSGPRDARDQVAAAERVEKNAGSTVRSTGGGNSAGVLAANQNYALVEDQSRTHAADGKMRAHAEAPQDRAPGYGRAIKIPFAPVSISLTVGGSGDNAAPREDEKDTSPMGLAVTAAVRQALDIADGLGVKRYEVARRMGKSLSTLESYVLPSRPQTITSAALLRLLTDTSVLPEPARQALWNQLARMGRMSIVAEQDVAMLAGGHPARQALEIAAARMLSISTRTLWKLTSRGEIPCVRVGRRVLYEVEQLRQWLASNRSGVSVSGGRGSAQGSGEDHHGELEPRGREENSGGMAHPVHPQREAALGPARKDV